jgi:[acyl-carrier-protein] S-malonyltransferase
MTTKRIAFIYPGQGSQYVGMGRDLWESNDEMRSLLHEAEITLGRPIAQYMFDGPEEVLRDTANAQPAIFLHETILTRVLDNRGIRPAIVAGHSVGEYAALTAANVIDYGHALWLINQRAALMSEVGQLSPGSMAAILGLDDAEVERCCREVGANVVVANYNCPGQVVISGDRTSLDAAIAKCKEAGAKRALPLAVSGAFHSPLVADANLTLAENIKRVIFRDAEIPVITNVDGKAHTSGDQIRNNLLVQMESSVQWTKTMETLKTAEVDAIVEVGPGSVLSGLARRLVSDIPLFQVGTLEQAEGLSCS